MSIVKTFADNSTLEYDQGGFDTWCIYLTRPGVARHAPLDINYFTRLQQLGTVYTVERMYSDFVAIYDITTKQLSEEVLNQISFLAQQYNNDSIEIEILFTILYMGMIAEENKRNTKLGKRIKRLGLHQVLIEGMHPQIAANFSRGMGWRAIDNECKNRGF